MRDGGRGEEAMNQYERGFWRAGGIPNYVLAVVGMIVFAVFFATLWGVPYYLIWAAMRTMRDMP